MLSRYRGKTNCPDCKGSRLRNDANYVLVNQKSITDLVLMPISTIAQFFESMKLNVHDAQIAKRIVAEIKNHFCKYTFLIKFKLYKVIHLFYQAPSTYCPNSSTSV